MIDSPSWAPLVARAAVVGVLGGAGLMLTAMYSRRGPLIYPVYAALLATLAWVASRFTTLTYAALFVAVLTGMVVATTMALAAVLVLGAKQRRELKRSGRVMRAGSPPPWGLPLIAAAIIGASAAAAYIAS